MPTTKHAFIGRRDNKSLRPFFFLRGAFTTCHERDFRPNAQKTYFQIKNIYATCRLQNPETLLTYTPGYGILLVGRGRDPPKKGFNIMAKTERIAQIERELWLMEFKDHWTAKDWAERAKLNAELYELKKGA